MAYKAEYHFNVYQGGLKINGTSGVTIQNSQDEIIDELIRVINLSHYGLTRSDVTNSIKKLSTGYWILEAQKDTYHFTLQINRLS